MTNKEYFERNNIPFAKAMKMYDVKKYGTFEQFLYAKHRVEHKYNVGDIIIWRNSGCPIVIYDIVDEQYLCVFHTITEDLGANHFIKDMFGEGLNINDVDTSEEYIKIGHSDLQFAVKLGIIEDEDISREISEYE